MLDVKEKLVELLNEKQCAGYAQCYEGFEQFSNGEIADHLIANGGTVLPCKIGDVFWIKWVGDIKRARCSMLTQKADGSWKVRVSVDNGWGSSVDVSLDEIGKILFKTKEEAETHMTQPPKGLKKE